MGTLVSRVTQRGVRVYVADLECLLRTEGGFEHATRACALVRFNVFQRCQRTLYRLKREQLVLDSSLAFSHSFHCCSRHYRGAELWRFRYPASRPFLHVAPLP